MARAILDGARFGENHQAMAYARERVIDAYAAHEEICRITHCADAVHVDGSSHYRDCADDYGLVDIPEEKRLAILRDAMEALNAGALVYGKFEGEPYSDFLLIYGDENHKQHVHLQWKPVRAMNR
jgi:hypothetical protein